MDDTALEHAAKHAQQNYVCPMHPEIISNDPNATCPICGMDLVPLESGGEAGIVKLTPTVMNSLGVRTAKAKRRTLYRRIDSVGYINVDENNIRTISLRSEGWVERLVVKTSGERVTKGQLLMELYAPVLVNAQEEYLQAMRHNNELLINASRDRLIALGVAEEQISNLEETKAVEPLVKVYAPQAGIVSELEVREGMFVKPSQNLLNLVDLSSVWLMVDIFERQADWVKTGQRAEATLPFMPGKSWEGKVEYVYPSLDASTRSLKVRLRFDNLEEDLKPNMYADVTIYAKPKRKVLTIPREALIRTGNENRVVVALGGGKFIPMPVSTGMETDDRVEVLSGLAEGDEVVTSSQFLIDSESSLKAALARMAGG
jgi:Cu(I)/Ag(I) efflux system membrane fusion protein